MIERSTALAVKWWTWPTLPHCAARHNLQAADSDVFVALDAAL